MESGSGDVLYYANQTFINTTQQSGIKLTLAVSHGILSTVQLLLCSIVLLIFYRVPTLRTVSNLPVVNLVASDFVRAIVGFLAIPVFAEWQTFTPSTVDHFLCVAYKYTDNVQFAWSSWAIAIVAYSRSDAIVNVLDPKFNEQKFWKFAVISWLVSLLTAMPPFLGWSSYGYQRNADSSVYFCQTGLVGKGLFHALYDPCFYFVNFVVPNVLVIFCFSRVVPAAIRHQRNRRAQRGKQNVIVLSLPSSSKGISTEEDEQQKQQHWRAVATKTRDIVQSKAFRYIVVIVMSNVLLLAPLVFLTSYHAVRSELELTVLVPDTACQITALLFSLNFNVNSFLYVFWIRSFQQSATALCCSGRC